MVNKNTVKQILGEIPLTAELYWQFFQRGNPPGRGFILQRIEKWLPQLHLQAEAALKAGTVPTRRRIMIFSTLRYWIEHATLLGMAMAGLGHEVTLIYLPYAKWGRPLDRFDLRRQNAYARNILRQASPLLHPISLLDVQSEITIQEIQRSLPSSLVEAIQEVSLRDTQYTLQIEDVNCDGDKTPSARLYQLRLERNLHAASSTLTWIQSLPPKQRPEVMLTPNGSILEMGAIYQVARHLGIPVVTYEFGEQRGRIWLAQNAEVMLQETDDLWEARQALPLTDNQWEQVRALYGARQNARLWENFSRLWQGLPSQGGEQVHQALDLDARPVVLLAANVIGDSLTLGRQVFSQSMTEWLERTIQLFAQRTDVQLVIRLHPGERYTKGPSVAQVVQRVLPDLPSHMRLVSALDPINTYDLVEIADLGLVYTTTVGMEMAMSGVPVIVVGETHYRGKGFTLDPERWEAYYLLLDQVLTAPRAYRLTREQVERAWTYAYRFFFDYPSPFPWHLMHWWKELEDWSMERVLSTEGQAIFGNTFRYLAGEPRLWRAEEVVSTA